MTANPLRAPRPASDFGSPAALEAEGRVRRHRKTREVDAARDPGHEFLVSGSPQGVVEVLDHGDLDSGRLQANEPLVRVAQQRRRQTLDDLLGVGVESDDRRPGPGTRRRLAEFA